LQKKTTHLKLRIYFKLSGVYFIIFVYSCPFAIHIILYIHRFKLVLISELQFFTFYQQAIFFSFRYRGLLQNLINFEMAHVFQNKFEAQHTLKNDGYHIFCFDQIFDNNWWINKVTKRCKLAFESIWRNWHSRWKSRQRKSVLVIVKESFLFLHWCSTEQQVFFIL